MAIIFKQNTAGLGDILTHLIKCDKHFVPPLSEKIDIKSYSQKLKNNATLFEAWSGSFLVGFVAVYINNHEEKSAFISNVSIEDAYKRKGISSELMQRCIAFVRQKEFVRIILEVNENNEAAVGLYIKFGFSLLSRKNNSIFMQLNLA